MTGKKRRPQGTGGLYQRCDTKRGCPPLDNGHRPNHKCRGLWVGTIEAGYDGVRRRRTVSSTDPDVAQAKLDALVAELDAGRDPLVEAAAAIQPKPGRVYTVERDAAGRQVVRVSPFVRDVP